MIHGKLSVVLPAHNEVDNLPAVVDRALTVLPALVEAFELVVVDDGSIDGTGVLADQLAVDHPEVVVVHHARNRGYGAALTSGFTTASGDFIMFMDSDQQFDIADLAHLAPFVGSYDIVAGYRIKRQDATYRLIYAEIFRLAMRAVFGIRLRDIDCAFKVFRADLLRSMTLESPGALINTEILAKARQAGATWIEIGVNHYPRLSGASSGGSPKVVLRAMRETIFLWLRMLRYTPPKVAMSGNRPIGVAVRMLPVVIGGIAVALAAGLTSRLSRRRRS